VIDPGETVKSKALNRRTAPTQGRPDGSFKAYSFYINQLRAHPRDRHSPRQSIHSEAKVAI
jgi:hypothetical protein